MKLTVHVGLPKAASTTLQSMLSAQREQLMATGTLVPLTGHRRDRAAADGVTPGHDLIVLLAAAPRRLRTLVQGFVDTARESSCDRIFVSTENFTHPHNLDQLEMAERALTSVCSVLGVDLQFLLVDRSDRAWARSYYNELVLDGRSHESRTWQDFETDLRVSGVSASSIRDKCRQLMTDRLKLTSSLDAGIETIIAEIAEISGAQLDVNDIPLHRASPSDEQVEIARERNAQLKGSGKGWGGAGTLRAWLATQPEPLRRAVRRAYRAWLARTTPIR